LNQFSNGINRIRIIPIPKNTEQYTYLSFRGQGYVFSFVKGMTLSYANESFSWNTYPLDYTLSLIDSNLIQPIILYQGRNHSLSFADLPMQKQLEIKSLTEKNYQVQLSYRFDFKDDYPVLTGTANTVDIFKLTAPSINALSFDFDNASLSWSVNNVRESGYLIKIKQPDFLGEFLYDSPPIPYLTNPSTGKPNSIQSFSMKNLSNQLAVGPGQYDIELRPYSNDNYVSLPATTLSILYGLELKQDQDSLYWDEIPGFTYQLINKSKVNNNIVYEGSLVAAKIWKTDFMIKDRNL
jgi:hypothetical protein